MTDVAHWKRNQTNRTDQSNEILSQILPTMLDRLVGDVVEIEAPTATGT